MARVPQAMAPNPAGLAPAPVFPERQGNVYEVKQAEQRTGNRGPLRFEEGLATDTDVPSEFVRGAQQGYITAPGRPNHNANVYEKPAAETLAERAHPGSSAWVEAPTVLGEFAHGSYSDFSAVTYEEVNRDGSPIRRINPASIDD